MNQKQIIQLAKEIITDRLYMTISTCSSDGKPWISPVYTAFDNDYTFYWRSRDDALHSQYITQNPNVAIVIYNSEAPHGEGRGVYFEAEAYEVNETQEIEKAVSLLAKRVNKTPQPIDLYTGETAKKIYKAIPTKAWVSIIKLIDNEIFDERVEFDLRDLR